MPRPRSTKSAQSGPSPSTNLSAADALGPVPPADAGGPEVAFPPPGPAVDASAPTEPARYEPARYGSRLPATIPLAERLVLPSLADLEVVGWVSQALRDATLHRQGVLVTGPKGFGKSEGRRLAEAEFHAREAERRVGIPGYVPLQLRTIPPARPETRVDLIRLLYEGEMGTIPPRVAAGGVDFMLGELVEGWREDNVAALVFDEVDHFGAGALEGCRDVIARADDSAGRARAAYRAAGGLAVGPAAASATPTGADASRPRPRGIGVVLLGTPGVADRMRRHAEWGQRWRRAYEVDGLTASVLPEVYRQLLPAFARVADRVGAAAWRAFIAEAVAPGIAGSIRRVEAHVVDYVTLWCDTAAVQPETPEEVGFDEATFLDALAALAAPEGRGR